MLPIYLQTIESDEDRSVVERVYERYRRLMYKVAFGFLDDPEDAEDAVQQAFLSMIEHVERLREVADDKFPAYVSIITERKAIDILRKKRRLEDVGSDEDRPGVELALPDGEGLDGAIAKLPAMHREAILLRYAFGYSTAETADMLRLKPGAASKLIYRAKQQIEKSLTEGDDRE